MNIETNPAKISSTLFQSNKLKAYITRLKNTRKEAMVKYYKEIGRNDSDISRIMDPTNKDFIYDILPSGEILSKSHESIFINSDNPCMGGYDDVVRTPMERKTDFGDDIDFTVPNVGRAVSDCMILIKLSKLRSKRDVRYVDYLGHKIFDSVEITIGKYRWKYGPELNNVKRYVNRSGENAWNECMGQSNNDEFIINIKEKEYQLKGTSIHGHQAYKKIHDGMTLCIPIHLGIKKGNSIPLIDNFDISIKATITDLENIICFRGEPERKIKRPKKDKKREEPRKPMVSCEIEDVEFYTTHCYENDTNWLLTIFKWPTSYLKTYDTFTKCLRAPMGTCNFEINEGVINNIYVCFRPIENLTNPKYWFCNQFVEHKSQKILVDGNEQQLIWNEAQIPIKKDVVHMIELKICHYEQSLDVKYSSNYMAYKNNYDSRFGPWFVFPNIKYNDIYDNNRNLIIDYSSTSISSARPANIIVIVEKLVELNVDGKHIFNEMNIIDENFYVS